MICLFCKQDSSQSKSVEHIIPESLGNTLHILPVGLVCDGCNNYFAIKVEKILLEQSYFKSLRHRNEIVSKKGKLVPERGIIPHADGGIVDVLKQGPSIMVNVSNNKLFKLISDKKVNSLIIPKGEAEPFTDNEILSRFLAKAAIEALMHRLIDHDGWIDEIMNKVELDDIKQYARFGGKFWPYSQRKIYNEEDMFFNTRENAGPYQVLHEFDFLWTKELECYFVLAIMGIEYAINVGGPSIESYTTWLQENNHQSTLIAKDTIRIESEITKPEYISLYTDSH